MSDIEKRHSHEPDSKAATDGSGLHEQPVEVDLVAERKLVRKLDLYVVPVVMLLYLLSFLDR